MTLFNHSVYGWWCCCRIITVVNFLPCTGLNHLVKCFSFYLASSIDCLRNFLSRQTQTHLHSYDNMCNSCRLRVAKKPLPLPPPMDHAWLSVQKIIDTFHLTNHTSDVCHTKYSPEEVKQRNPSFNTQVGEQNLSTGVRNAKNPPSLLPP